MQKQPRRPCRPAGSPCGGKGVSGWSWNQALGWPRPHDTRCCGTDQVLAGLYSDSESSCLTGEKILWQCLCLPPGDASPCGASLPPGDILLMGIILPLGMLFLVGQSSPLGHPPCGDSHPLGDDPPCGDILSVGTAFLPVGLVLGAKSHGVTEMLIPEAPLRDMSSLSHRGGPPPTSSLPAAD